MLVRHWQIIFLVELKSRPLDTIFEQFWHTNLYLKVRVYNWHSSTPLQLRTLLPPYGTLVAGPLTWIHAYTHAHRVRQSIRARHLTKLAIPVVPPITARGEVQLKYWVRYVRNTFTIAFPKHVWQKASNTD